MNHDTNKGPHTSDPGKGGPTQVTHLVGMSPELDKGLTVEDVIGILRRGLWLIVLLPAVAIGLQFWSLKDATPIYTAYLQVAAPGEDGDKARSGLLGIARTLRVVEGSETLSKFDRYLHGMTTVNLAERLEGKYDITKPIFAGEWNEATQQWHEPRWRGAARIYVSIRRILGLPIWSSPDARSLSDYLREEVHIDETLTPGIHEISYSNKDPQFAVNLIRLLHEETESMFLESDKAEKRNAIEYLTEKLSTVTFAEHRAVLVNLLAEQEQTMMLMREDAPYAARVIDGPYASVYPTAPRPIFSLGLAGLTGGVFGVLLAFLREALRRRGGRSVEGQA